MLTKTANITEHTKIISLCRLAICHGCLESHNRAQLISLPTLNHLTSTVIFIVIIKDRSTVQTKAGGQGAPLDTDTLRKHHTVLSVALNFCGHHPQGYMNDKSSECNVLMIFNAHWSDIFKSKVPVSHNTETSEPTCKIP